MSTRVNYMRDGGVLRLTPAQRAKVRKLEEQALGLLKRRRRRPLPKVTGAGTTLGPALTVRIVLDRETDRRWIAESSSVGVSLYGASKRDAVDRAVSATFAILGSRIRHGEEQAPRSVAFDIVDDKRAKQRHLDADPRPPEQRKVDEEVYRLCESGEFFSGFKRPKPRKPAKRAKPKRKRTGARR